MFVQVGDTEYSVFGSVESPIYVRRELISTYLPNVDHWTGDGPTKVLAAYDADDTLLGGVMPYRVN